MSNARAMELDATRLGDALMTAYMISVQLGHKHVANPAGLLPPRPGRA
jgi:hypothetical protein